MNQEIKREIIRTKIGKIIVIVKQRDESTFYTKVLTGKGVKTNITAQRTCTEKGKEKETIAELIARTVDKVERTVCESEKTGVDYAALFEDLMEDDAELLCSPAWRAASTRRSALAFFLKNVAPLINKMLAKEKSPEDLQADILKAVKENQHERRKGDLPEERVKILDARADGIADQHIAEANTIYEKSRNLLPKYELPPLNIPRIVVEKVISVEQCKALPWDIMIKLAASFWADLEKTSLAVGAIIMMCALTRPAETCPKFGEIVDYGDYGVYAVLTQTDGSVRITELKSISGVRIIILSKYAMDAIRRCRQMLVSRGFSEDQINDAYIVSEGANPFCMAKPSDLSEYIRKTMNKFGLKEDYWRAVSLLAEREPDLDEYGNRLGDLRAYVLRRSGCTYLVNCTACPDTGSGASGAPVALVDALMGHKLFGKDADWAKWIRRDDNWPLIAQMLESIVLDPEHSAHPAFSTKDTVCDNATQICHVVQRYVVSAEDAARGEVSLQIRCHGKDKLTMHIPRGAKIADQRRYPQSRQESFLPYVQEIVDRNYYKKLIGDPSIENEQSENEEESE